MEWSVAEERAVCEVARDLATRRLSESLRLQRFREVFEGRQAKPPVPKDATAEKKNLATLARTPWLRLVCASTAQPLKVTGYRNPADGSDSPLWDVWQRNDMDSRQQQLNYDIVRFGYAFMQVVPGTDVDGSTFAVMRPVSPQMMVAEYDDPYMDEYPLRALRKIRDGKYKYLDQEFVYDLEGEGQELRVVGRVAHGAGVCPVVLYPNMMDLEGNCVGEIEPYMDVASRLDLTTNDRLLVQRYNSWKILYATQMEPPKELTPEQRERTKMKLRNDAMLIGTGDTKFGTLDETNMTPFITAADADRNDLSAVSQTPMSMLTGEMINLGADAITTSYRPWREKLKERLRLWGDAHGRMFRVAAMVMGLEDEARNYSARVVWDDVEDRSLAQTADAFGKLAQMLEVPPQVLWPKIPGVEQSELEEWRLLHDARRAEELRTEAMLSGEMAIELPEPKATVDTGAQAGPTTPESWEDQRKPWGAKRGPRRSQSSIDRRARKRDGDGDGVFGE